MATTKQKLAVEKTLENLGSAKPRPQGQILREVGYSEAVSKTPTIVTESKGFKELCDELGLTDNLIVKSLVEDIKKKKGNRKPELELAAKLKGHLKEKGLGDLPPGSGFLIAWQSKK